MQQITKQQQTMEWAADRLSTADDTTDGNPLLGSKSCSSWVKYNMKYRDVSSPTRTYNTHEKAQQELSKVIDQEYRETMREGRKNRREKRMIPPNYSSSVIVDKIIQNRNQVHCGSMRTSLVQGLRTNPELISAIQPPQVLPQPPPRIRLSTTTNPRSVARVYKEIPQLKFSARKLPSEMFIIAFGYLNFSELCRASRVCKSWEVSSTADWLWRSISKKHGSKIQPTDDMSWKQAFSNHIKGMRSDLDQELAGLMTIVKRSDKLLEEAHARSRDDDISIEGPNPNIKNKVVNLEQQVEFLKRQVATAHQFQSTIQFSRKEQQEECSKLNIRLTDVRDTLTLLKTTENRKAFATEFQKRVIRTCFSNTPQSALPIAIMRGTDTFGQMELLSFTIPSGGHPWSSNWCEFKRLFPLNDSWHSLLNILTAAPDPNSIGPVRSVGDQPSSSSSSSSSLTENTYSQLRLPFPKGSKYDTLIRMMSDMIQTSPRDLLASLTPQGGHQS